MVLLSWHISTIDYKQEAFTEKKGEGVSNAAEPRELMLY